MAEAAMTAAPLEFSPLDERRFGVKTAKLSPATAEEVEHGLARAREARVRFLIVRIDAAHLDAVHGMERAGGLLMDTLAHWEGDLEPSLAIASPLPIREASATEAPAIESLATQAFARYASHYSADPRLEAAAVQAIYPDWARRSCVDKAVADAVFAAWDGERAAGFCTVKTAAADTVSVPLMAVSPQDRGRGLFGHLLDTARRWARVSGAARLHYSTQATNLVTQRRLAAAGFVPVRYEYTLHLWIP